MGDWRESKTILECHRHMLDKEIFCDVTFEVGPGGGATEIIRAHKYMLAARSEVFLAMFNSELQLTGKSVRIVDIGPEDFRNMLRYIYCDDTRLTSDNITEQVYAAEKYMLYGLTRYCERWMERNMGSDNACVVMQCAELHCKENLFNTARTFILQNAETVLAGPSFVKLSMANLKELVSNDELVAQENLIYEACLRWAQHNLSESGEQETGSAIRRVLGDSLQVIRFPLMKPARFVELMVKFPGVLSKDEEISVMRSYNSNIKGVFSSRQRKHLQLHYLRRFNSVSEKRDWKCGNGKPDAIRFKCDMPICLRGITIYGNEGSSTNVLQVDILDDYGTSIYEHPKESIRLSSSQDPMHVPFEQEVHVSADRRYTIIQRMWGDNVYGGSGGKERIVCEGVTFDFTNTRNSKNGTDVSCGQIPGFVFW